MRKFVILVLAGACSISVFAGEDSSITEAQDLVWNVYVGLYTSDYLDQAQKVRFERIANEAWSSKAIMVDGLLFLQEQTLEGVAPSSATVRLLAHRKRLPHFESQEIWHHIGGLYQRYNAMDQPIFDMGKDQSARFTSFLVLADQLDGALDTHLELPKLLDLYDLLVTRGTPLAAIGFNHRENKTWVDRRTLIDLDKLERELPKSLLKLRRSKQSDRMKLKKIMAYVQKMVVAVDDGWDSDLWQTPVETLLVGEGDCEDFAILFHAIAAWVGVETRVVVGYAWFADGQQLIEGNGHAWVEYQGKIIDPTSTVRVRARYEATLSFDAQRAQFTTPGELPTFKRMAAK